ncbi:glycosyltransferase [Nostoc sp. KVJ3]|uniref:glycosyltransferase n=1 Tax=Nostoc sp. KVJ3 TaxID=457945 RepID=UPI002238DF74|nr:glycosyltransferase [Nostoc sp. KVJ3]MCW5315097.1 glycosyltransferase [Nostoc sp. KVJ3]
MKKDKYLFAEKLNLFPDEKSRIFIVSMREISNLVALCNLYEFEDVLSDIDAVDMVKPLIANDGVGRKIYKLAKYLTNSKPLAEFLVPGINPYFLNQEYELFFPIFNSPFELFTLHSFKNWRQKCSKAVCYIVEFWESYLQPSNLYFLEFLKDFDHIFIGTKNSTEAIAKITGRPCTYLPPGIDTLKFSPYPLLPARSIDVCNLGRCSSVTHQALLEFARQQQMFYYYDTIKSYGSKNAAKQQTFAVKNAQEHRSLLANLIKRSRYFFANRARANEPEVTRTNQEFGSRFFEGAAAGAVMIGDPPISEEFDKYFDWPDAIIKMPFDAPEIGKIITDLDAQPERLARIRKDNVVNSLLRHDWVYRLQTIFEAVDVQPSEIMLSRETELKNLANQIQQMDTSLIHSSPS